MTSKSNSKGGDHVLALDSSIVGSNYVTYRSIGGVRRYALLLAHSHLLAEVGVLVGAEAGATILAHAGAAGS